MNFIRKLFVGAVAAIVLVWPGRAAEAEQSAPAGFAGGSGGSGARHDYVKAFMLALQFYEAQQSGKLSPNNRFPWRGDSCLTDGHDVGRDLSGGWYDAGDHWKCNLTMGYAASVMVWNVVTFPEAYKRHGQMPRVKENLKHVADYFNKCIVDPAPEALENFDRYEVFVDIGGKPGPEPGVHSVWEGPETIEGKTIRQAVKVTRDVPGCDVTGAMAATLCGVAVLFQNHAESESDRVYARELLHKGRKLFLYSVRYHAAFQALVRTNKVDGDKLPVIAPEGKTRVIAYRSFDSADEVVWAGLWAHRAELALKTTGYTGAHLQAIRPLETAMPVRFLGWGEVGAAALMMLLQTDDAASPAERQRRERLVEQSINQHVQRKRTEDGLSAPTGAMVLQYAGPQWLMAMTYARYTTNQVIARTYREFARSQVNYLLGDNRYGTSFMVGYGKKWWRSAHHRGAHNWWSDPKDRSVGWRSFNEKTENRYVLYGAVMAGPNGKGEFKPNHKDWQSNEVALTMNIGPLGALAGICAEEISNAGKGQSNP